MTPEQHLKMAEGLMGDLTQLTGNGVVTQVIAAAQVHATLALVPAAAPLPRPKPRPAERVEVFDVELHHLAVTTADGGSVVLNHPAADWSTLLDDPAQVRLLADALTAHADRMENR